MIAVAVLIIFGFVYLSFSNAPRHDHATMKIFICGKETFLGAEVGTHALHIHAGEPEKLHIESQTSQLKDLFNFRTMNFNRTYLLGYKVGEDGCKTGKPATISMTVNGIPSTLFETYPPKEGDLIIIKYE